MNRRQFLGGLAAIPIVGAATGFYTWQIEPYWVEYVRQPLPIKNLPPDLEGRTLVQFSDIHVGNRFDWGYIVQAFGKVAELQPDIVVYTGDYTSYETAKQFGQVQEVMQSAPLGTLGTAAILGNHDYGHGWSMPEVADEITNILTETGIRVLRNDLANVEGLNIIGLDDRWATNYDPSPIMKQVQPGQANLVLSHNPDSVDDPVWSGYKGWILAGHTHGGQVKPPFLEPPMLPVRNKRYTSGVIDLSDGRMLYINRAIGSLWPVRFNARPEVTIFTLKAS